MSPQITFNLLILLGVANGAPVLARRLAGKRWEAPVDGGLVWIDGKRLLGESKTWLGVAAAITGCVTAGAGMGLNPGFAIVFGALAMVGDLSSSFTKRRLGLPPSARATGLDQLPEALLPTLSGMAWLDYGPWETVIATGLFIVLDILVSPLLHRLGLRRQPY